MNYNGANSSLFVNGVEIIKFKTNDSEFILNALCLGNVSKDFSASKMIKKTTTKKQDYMELFMILVLIMVIFQLMIY